MTDALTYENFLRSAFGFAQGRDPGRHGDPAGLADTDVFNGLRSTR